jgi:hypothetical protein
MTVNNCGTCTACCRVFEIPEIKKAAGTWCEHCAIGRGCTIYEDRPQMCAEFSCLWLMSQQREDPRERFSPELRPDKCKVVFSPSTNEAIIAATTMPGAPLAWERRDVMGVIRNIVSGGMAVVAGAPRSTTRTMIDKDGMHEVRLTEPDSEGMMWGIPD